MISNDFSEEKGSDKLKSEFLTLGSGMCEGLKGKHMFLWGFYE